MTAGKIPDGSQIFIQRCLIRSIQDLHQMIFFSDIYTVDFFFANGHILQKFQADPLIPKEKLIGHIAFHICHELTAGQGGQRKFRLFGENTVFRFGIGPVFGEKIDQAEYRQKSQKHKSQSTFRPPLSPPSYPGTLACRDILRRLVIFFL